MPDGIGRSPHPPPSGDFVALAAEWCTNQSALLLGYVWQAYDTLQSSLPPGIDPEDMERSITQSLQLRIERAMTRDEPFQVQHGSYERETKKPAPAQPKEYDIAFVLIEDDRIMWPLEAKVLRRAKNVREYVAAVKDRFLACRYAPFSSEAAMLGYLLSNDDPETAFQCIASRLHCPLKPHTCFRDRPHRVSRHNRIPPPGRSYPRRFTCHHLMLQFPSLSPEPELPLK